ncbi:MAG TPA: cytochrome c oxidase assembly protein [Acidimicrobiales bacterium]|nr:cytochrome c oxidase assembly protein [Acidimicrobiales bacterium]
MTGSPWAFHVHLLGWVGVVAIGGVYWALVRRPHDGTIASERFRAAGPGAPAGPPNAGPMSVAPNRRQLWQLAAGLGALAVAVTWPLADLAAHWSLTALLVQRMLLTLVVAPALVLATPTPVLSRLTRPALVDSVVDVASRPPVAIAVFSTIVVGTLTNPAVAAQSSSAMWVGTFDGLLLVAGVVLWLPVLGQMPGARRPSSIGRAAYLIVQSVVPNFPAVIFVFARHPLYGAFAHSVRAIGLSALNDQQLAGVVAKVGTLPVLWSAAWVVLNRGQRAEELGVDETPLTWAQVERALERSARAERRRQRLPVDQ